MKTIVWRKYGLPDVLQFKEVEKPSRKDNEILIRNGETLLIGLVVDQAAVHGLLRKVRDLGMPLVSVIHVTPEQTDESDIKP